MRLLSLAIDGFRGIQHAKITFSDHTVLIGPNGSGKSTIIDALSLVFARTRMVRDLTEHDFCGSCPTPTSRIRIVATIGGFAGNDPERHHTWFRDGRAVPKWWDSATGEAVPEPSSTAVELCAQIGFAARFDAEELAVEQLRYFHDDEGIEDVFQEDVVQPVPLRLFDDIGYYVLPARRTWESTASFASDLFRRTVATVGGLPAATILGERDRLRQPAEPLESAEGLLQLVERMNTQLGQLLAHAPRFRLRVTATDSESLLRSLVPHYGVDAAESPALPVFRHGTGLLSLQTFVLLLELGRERIQQGKPFLLALEEPELHVPPGLQRRLVAEAATVADQTICTSHSPRVASFFPPTSVQLLDRRPTKLASTALLGGPLGSTATSAARKLFHDDRPRVIEALMHHRVLIPEGRTDHEWLHLLSDTLETGNHAISGPETDTPPFGAVVGVVPTHNSAVCEVYKRLAPLRSGLVPLLDGDHAGDDKIGELRALETPPELILQWRTAWSIEDALGWVLAADEEAAMPQLQERLDREFSSLEELIALLKIKEGAGRLKTDYLAYQEIAAVIAGVDACRGRAKELLSAITLAVLRREGESDIVTIEGELHDPPLLRLGP